MIAHSLHHSPIRTAEQTDWKIHLTNAVFNLVAWEVYQKKKKLIEFIFPAVLGGGSETRFHRSLDEESFKKAALETNSSFVCFCLMLNWLLLKQSLKCCWIKKPIQDWDDLFGLIRGWKLWTLNCTINISNTTKPAATVQYADITFLPWVLDKMYFHSDWIKYVFPSFVPNFLWLPSLSSLFFHCYFIFCPSIIPCIMTLSLVPHPHYTSGPVARGRS